jgi:hypothetical protein
MNIQNLSDLDWSVRVRLSTAVLTSRGTDLKNTSFFFSFIYTAGSVNRQIIKSSPWCSDIEIDWR